MDYSQNNFIFCNFWGNFMIILFFVYINQMDVFLRRSILFFVFITGFEIFELVTFLAIPVLIHRLTELLIRQ